MVVFCSRSGSLPFVTNQAARDSGPGSNLVHIFPTILRRCRVNENYSIILEKRAGHLKGEKEQEHT